MCACHDHGKCCADCQNHLRLSHGSPHKVDGGRQLIGPEAIRGRGRMRASCQFQSQLRQGVAGEGARDQMRTARKVVRCARGGQGARRDDPTGRAPFGVLEPARRGGSPRDGRGLPGTVASGGGTPDAASHRSPLPTRGRHGPAGPHGRGQALTAGLRGPQPTPGPRPSFHGSRRGSPQPLGQPPQPGSIVGRHERRTAQSHPGGMREPPSPARSPNAAPLHSRHRPSRRALNRSPSRPHPAGCGAIRPRTGISPSPEGAFPHRHACGVRFFHCSS